MAVAAKLAYSRRNSMPCHASRLHERPCTREAVVELARTDGRAGGAGSGTGLFNLVSVVVLAVSVLAVGIAAALLARTMAAALSIDKKAATIAQTASGINTATDSVLLLNRTNATAASILETAKPLDGQVSEIVTLANDIDGLGKSINGTPARSIIQPVPSTPPQERSTSRRRISTPTPRTSPRQRERSTALPRASTPRPQRFSTSRSGSIPTLRRSLRRSTRPSASSTRSSSTPATLSTRPSRRSGRRAASPRSSSRSVTAKEDGR